VPKPEKARATAQNVPDDLSTDLHLWWQHEGQDWDDMVAGGSGHGLTGSLWDGLPEVDSKTVARSSPIFEKHLGIPLDIKQIRPGGYKDISDMISDLVPKMLQVAVRKNRTFMEMSA
jgi:hypothetical protein